MRVDIMYEKEIIQVEIPKPCEILFPKKVIIKNENEIIEEAIKQPLGNNSIQKFIEKSNQLLVI